MKLHPGLIFLAVTVFSVLIYFFYFNSTESRTRYPLWSETSNTAWEPDNTAAGVAAAASTGGTAGARTAQLWIGTGTSNQKPSWTGPTDTSDLSQLDLTKRWINKTVTDGITSDSITSSGTNGIKSILVRKNNGLTAELPIMEFFEKLHEDNYLGYLRAKDYTDGKINDLTTDWTSPTSSPFMKWGDSIKIKNAAPHAAALAGGQWMGQGWYAWMVPGEGDSWRVSRG